MNRRRRYGQHLLVSEPIAAQIADIAGITSEDTVLEIGTGDGILVPHLCGRAGRVVSIETDRTMYETACRKFSFDNLEIVHGNGFETDRLFSVFVSNLPYSASRTAIEWLCQKEFSHGAIMVQKEFAAKLFRQDKSVSVIALHCLEMKLVLNVGKNNFRPAPRVDSAVLYIRKKHTISRDVIRTVNLLFSHRRKTLSGIYQKFGMQRDLKGRLDDISADRIIAMAEEIITHTSATPQT